MKFHLGLYNLSNKEKEKGLNNWLRTIGEAPVIYNEFQKDKTTDQLRLYLRNKGYYKAVVRDSVILKNKKARIQYYIRANEPYRIRNLDYMLEDTLLSTLISEGMKNTLLKKSELFDGDLLQKERERIELLARSNGYYYFKADYIFFRADTGLNSREVDLEMVIKKYREQRPDGSIREINHPLARINRVFINTMYDPKLALSDKDSYAALLDTMNVNSIDIIFSGYQNIKPTIVTESNYILPDQLYNISDVTRTYRNLSSLKAFKLVNISFREMGQTGTGERLMDCEILLTPATRQSFTVELEGTNSAGNIGAAGNLIYQHRNLFRGAETFDLRFKGALETLRESYQADFGNMVEIGTEMRINIPKFILPFKTDQFIKKYNPATSISLAYNFQRRPDYTRTIANAAFGYNWKGNRYLTHIINPIEVNLVQIPYKSPDFITWLEGKYIYYSYQPHLVTVSNYSMIYNNQNIQKTSDFVYFRLNLESAGNILSTGYDVLNIPKVDGRYELFNTEFAQYVRGDFDFRFYNIINKNNSIVYRLFAGAGVPYKNSTALPFEKKYFAGGANSIRAWQVRNLGPGSYNEIVTSSYPNKTADIKLEGNFEYRFKLIKWLEGAFFVDAGNIWAINSSDEREGAIFKPSSFYKEIAVGTGLGTRFDFTFFIFRLDLGIKARDPVLPEGDRWIIGKRKMTRDDFTVNIGIGYPF